MFMEPPPPDLNTLPQSLVSLMAWIVIAILMSLWSLLDKSARRKLASYAVAVNPTDPVTGAAVDPSQPPNNEPPTTDQRQANGGDSSADRKPGPFDEGDDKRRTDH
jgi:hypothetical protein